MIKIKIGHGPEVLGYITLDGKKIRASGDIPALKKIINSVKTSDSQSSLDLINDILKLKGYVWSEVTNENT
jgi:hypothetical protein